MRIRTQAPRQLVQAGFTLIEVLVALGIVVSIPIVIWGQLASAEDHGSRAGAGDGRRCAAWLFAGAATG